MTLYEEFIEEKTDSCCSRPYWKCFCNGCIICDMTEHVTFHSGFMIDSKDTFDTFKGMKKRFYCIQKEGTIIKYGYPKSYDNYTCICQFYDISKHAKYCKRARKLMFRNDLVSSKTIYRLLCELKKEFYYTSREEGVVSKNGKVKRFKYWFCYLPKDILKIISEF